MISLLLDIQETQESRRKYWGFIKSLECFCLGLQQDRSRSPAELRPKAYKQRDPISRRRINAFNTGDFVAITYMSHPSDKGENCKKKYRVQNRNGRMFYPSTVRDCVWDRVFNYMCGRDVKLLWIDRQSIRQQEYTHKQREQKTAALHTMDQVYAPSHHPVGLLEMSIRATEDLSLLATILQGKLSKGNETSRNFRLADAVTPEQAWDAFNLLDAITDDQWWTRAWIYQEAYVVRKKMNLLLRHTPDLETKKRDLGLFGVVPGELCIDYEVFSHQATLLCLALQTSHAPRIKKVLGAAGGYRLLLDSSRSMTAQITQDVRRKELENKSDRLPIIANCCQYPVRINRQGRHGQTTSVSLSVFAMCLLNGEILHNALDSTTQRRASGP
ncbi:hypothetical protein F5Y16DRAFT_33014 [Xylariaceae sp. FL0255]|nr:hypothetical protein F5Y16DRAFT_33014 [Xylariaceae sp. FL0255]